MEEASATALNHFNDARTWAEGAYAGILEQADERVVDWPLMNPQHVAMLSVGYLATIFVLVVFMKVFRPKNPFELKFPMLIHNVVLTGLSAYMCIETLRQAFVVGKYAIWRNPVDISDKGLGMAKIIHIYYCSKVLEFLDTVFMALRCKFRQISFLHMYHHVSIFIIWWIVTLIAPGGESYFSVVLNSFIHVLLYGYYLWSSLVKIDYKKLGRKPRFTEPAFYRPYITRSQLLQFFFMLAQATSGIITPVEGYPYLCAQILFYYMFTMIGLFGNFYVRQYCSGSSRKKTTKSKKKKN